MRRDRDVEKPARSLGWAATLAHPSWRVIEEVYRGSMFSQLRRVETSPNLLSHKL